MSQQSCSDVDTGSHDCTENGKTVSWRGRQSEEECENLFQNMSLRVVLRCDRNKYRAGTVDALQHFIEHANAPICGLDLSGKACLQAMFTCSAPRWRGSLRIHDFGPT